MTPHVHSFLLAVLGNDATMALKKAADRSETLSTVLGARAIVGWLDLASRWGYKGEVPGLAGSYFRFAKAETGFFEGEIRLGKNAYEFKGVDLPHVAAGLSVALGADQAPDEDLRDADLAALGQNIDLLLKTQVIRQTTEWIEETDGESHGSEDTSSPEELEKAGGTTAPGEAAPQNPPTGPVAGGFTAPTAKQPRRDKKKGFGTKLTASQATVKCSVCDEPQFKGDRFLGCFCLRDLAKHANVEVDGEGYRITVDPEYWSKEDVSLLMDIVAEGT